MKGYSTKELSCFQTLLKNRIKLLSENISENKGKIEFNQVLLNKVEMNMSFSLGYELPKDYIPYIEKNIEWANQLINKYSGMADTSLFTEYDKVKKECLAVLDILGNVSAYLYPTVEFASDALSALKEKIIDEYVDSGNTQIKSKAMVKNDMRYEKASNELYHLTLLSKKVFAKVNTLNSLQKAVIQSISSSKESALRNIHQHD